MCNKKTSQETHLGAKTVSTALLPVSESLATRQWMNSRHECPKLQQKKQHPPVTFQTLMCHINLWKISQTKFAQQKVKHHFWWGNLSVLCRCISIETHSINDEQSALRAQETVPTLHQDRVHRHVFALSC